MLEVRSRVDAVRKGMFLLKVVGRTEDSSDVAMPRMNGLCLSHGRSEQEKRSDACESATPRSPKSQNPALAAESSANPDRRLPAVTILTRVRHSHILLNSALSFLRRSRHLFGVTLFVSMLSTEGGAIARSDCCHETCEHYLNSVRLFAAFQ